MQYKTAANLHHMMLFVLVSLLFYHLPGIALAQESEKISSMTFYAIDPATRQHDDTSSTSIYSSGIHIHGPLLGQAKPRKLHHRQEQLAGKKVIRDFVLYNYAHVADDIINGSGMYLDTLYVLLGIEENEKKTCRKNFLNILLEKKRIPDFSNCIARYDKTG